MRQYANVIVLDKEEAKATQNFVPRSNEIVIEQETGKFKVADGTTPYNKLQAVDPKILGGPQQTARQILAGSATSATDYAVLSSPPTVTLGTSGAAPTITGVRISPKRKTSTLIDTVNDPHFEYIGAIPDRLQVSSSDMCYADFLTGGSAQSARNHARIRFVLTGSACELYFRTRTTSLIYRILVDGVPVTKDFQTATVAVGGRYYLKVDFGGVVESRRITLEVSDLEFGGVVIAVNDSVSRQHYPSPLMMGVGDSHVRGANGVNWHDTYVRRTAERLKLQWANMGIGGSGFLNDNGTTGANFRNRLYTDIIPLKPAVLSLEGTWNDRSVPLATLTPEVDYVFTTLRAELPDTLLVAIGPWVVGHNLDATLDSFDAMLRARAEACGWNGYISFRDPKYLKSVASSWIASTAYALGDVVIANGFAQICISAHTSSTSFDQTKWRSTALVNGTGKVGTTTGLGNADVLISSDGVHGTALAHQVKSSHVTSEFLRIARKVSNGEYWAA